MLRWWRSRQLARKALEGEARDWSARQGRYASPLARERSIDAYLVGDMREQERWAQIRALIDEIEERADAKDMRLEGRGRR
jgi:hypothetical protein